MRSKKGRRGRATGLGGRPGGVCWLCCAKQKAATDKAATFSRAWWRQQQRRNPPIIEASMGGGWWRGHRSTWPPTRPPNGQNPLSVRCRCCQVPSRFDRLIDPPLLLCTTAHRTVSPFYSLGALWKRWIDGVATCLHVYALGNKSTSPPSTDGSG